MSFWNDHDEIWNQLAQELKGQFQDGGWFGADKVEARWKNWTITMDKYHVPKQGSFTRIRAPYINADGFRFKVYRKGIFTGIGKSLGLVQDIEIGDAFFDDEFVIQGNSEDKIRAMLHKPGLRNLIEAQPDISFEVKDDEGWFGGPFPEGVDELHFLARYLISDLEQLRGLYKLFAEVLDHLCSVGSAYKEDPGRKLA